MNLLICCSKKGRDKIFKNKKKGAIMKPNLKKLEINKDEIVLHEKRITN